MERSFSDWTLREFSSALASSAPVPGGGGAAALCGALAAALGSMVGNLTVGKKKYAEHEPRLRELLLETAALRQALLAQADADAAAFEPLSRAYAIPKDAPGRDEELEKCLRAAAVPPMEILRLSCRVAALSEEYARLGSRLMLSDAGCSAALSVAAIRAAALNVRVNTRLMKDRVFAERLNAVAEALLSQALPLAESVYAYVTEALT